MKIKCKQAQRIMFSSQQRECDSEEWSLIQQHVQNCVECKSAFEELKKADSILGRIKTPILTFSNEEELTKSIIMKINDETYSDSVSYLDFLIDFVSTRTVKFALGFVLILTTLSFTYMEYNDTKQIVSLEQKIGNRWNQKLIYSSVIQEEEGVLKFFYDAYKLFNGKSSYLEINKELVLMKKEDLRALFDDYSKLDEVTKVRLDEMRIQFFRDTSSVRSSGFSNNKIISLRKEIERLTKELEQSINKRGLK
jgi:hypothetical protein